MNSFPTSGDFCSSLITFADSLYLDQARRFVKPYLFTLMLFLKESLRKNKQMTNACNTTQHARINGPRGEKNLSSGFANNIGADQLAYPRSLIITYVIHLMKSNKSRLTTNEVSIF